MASLLESLLGGGVAREDEKRLSIKKRAPPARPRDLFDAFATMGLTASTEGLLRGFEMALAKPHVITYAVLGRWPTHAETAALPEPFKPARHLKQLLASEEFRRFILRRLLDAFPEKQRVLFVRLPRCAGGHVLATLEKGHPVLPHDLPADSYRDIDAVVTRLGEVTRMFGLTRTLAVVAPRMAPFVTSPSGTTDSADTLRWRFLEPPCRGTDIMFAIVRPPLDLALSQVNGVLTAARDGGGVLPLPGVAALPAREDMVGWRALGRRLLRDVVSRNPVCAALGDGTAAGTLAACLCTPIQLVGIDKYQGWARSALGEGISERINPSERIVRPEDLTAEESAWLDEQIAEDRVFYARFLARYSAEGLPAVAGFSL